MSILRVSHFPYIFFKEKKKAKYYNIGQLRFSGKRKISGKPFLIEYFYLFKPKERKFRSVSVQLLKWKVYGLFFPATTNHCQLRSQKGYEFVHLLQSSSHFPCLPYSYIFISSSNIVFYPIILSGHSSITSCAFPRHLYSPCTQFFFLAFMFCHKLLVLLPQTRVS